MDDQSAWNLGDTMTTISKDVAGSIFALQSPAAKRRLFETSDLQTANGLLAGEFGPHSIEAKGPASRFHSIAHKAQVAGITLYQFEYRSDILISDGESGEDYLLYIPVNGHVRLEFDEGFTDVAPGTIGIVNPGTNFLLQRYENCKQLALRIKPAQLEGVLLNRQSHTQNGPISFRSDLAIPYSECSSLVGLLEWIYSEMLCENTVLDNDFCGNPSGQLLARVLLRQFPNNYSDDFGVPRSNPAPFYVKRAEDYITRNAHEPISIDQIVDASCASARTLFEGFRKFRSTSPMRYLKDVRLNRVRAELLDIGSGIVKPRRLTEIAGDWGLAHMGNFSRDYKKKFLEQPSQTLGGGDKNAQMDS